MPVPVRAATGMLTLVHVDWRGVRLGTAFLSTVPSTVTLEVAWTLCGTLRRVHVFNGEAKLQLRKLQRESWTCVGTHMVECYTAAEAHQVCMQYELHRLGSASCQHATWAVPSGRARALKP